MSKLDYLFNKTLEKAIYTREFEKFVFEKIKNNEFRYPLYLSFGQEYIASSIATFLFEKKSLKKKIYNYLYNIEGIQYIYLLVQI